VSSIRGAPHPLVTTGGSGSSTTMKTDANVGLTSLAHSIYLSSPSVALFLEGQLFPLLAAAGSLVAVAVLPIGVMLEGGPSISDHATSSYSSTIDRLNLSC
jgi:hypothetical protein